MGDDAAEGLDHPDDEAIGADACDGQDREEQQYDEAKGFELSGLILISRFVYWV